MRKPARSSVLLLCAAQHACLGNAALLTFPTAGQADINKLADDFEEQLKASREKLEVSLSCHVCHTTGAEAASFCLFLCVIKYNWYSSVGCYQASYQTGKQAISQESPGAGGVVGGDLLNHELLRTGVPLPTPPSLLMHVVELHNRQIVQANTCLAG